MGLASNTTQHAVRIRNLSYFYNTEAVVFRFSHKSAIFVFYDTFSSTMTNTESTEEKQNSEKGDGCVDFVRSTCERTDMSEKFSKFSLQYKRQFAHIYFARSLVMHPKLEKAAKSKWGNDISIKKFSEVKANEKCCIIGTLFKSMELQPSILKEVSDEHNMQVQPQVSHFTSDNDKLILEDSQQRISLIGNINPGESYTGSIIACLGFENEQGQFEVEDLVYAGIPEQAHTDVKVEDDRYVLILSGIGIGNKHENSFQIQLLIDYILGMLGGEGDNELCSKIVHVIIAGNSLAKETLDRASQAKAKYLTYKSEASTVSAITELDQFLSQLVPFVSVDLMCGENDLSNHLLPQKPLHPCMLPFAQKYHGSTFHTVSNPYECKIDNIHFLGTSGQNVDNLKLYSNVNDNIRLLQDTLELQHLAPTAPDTLGSFPFYDTDPFVIDSCPDVYFCANQPKFEHKLIENEQGLKLLLLCVPEFAKTSSAVLVNLKNLHCEELCMSLDSEEDLDSMEASPEH